MLAPVSNGVVFRKAFLDPQVLSGFVKDVTGVDFVPGKIEAEKRFDPQVGSIDIELDVFAESADHRIIVELQRRRYGHNFDRFLGYHNASIIDQQREHKKYSIDRVVYTIVIITSPYRHADRTGRMVEDPLLISSSDPRTHLGEPRPIFGHQLIYLNPAHKAPGLPPAVQAWLDFFMASMKEEITGDRWQEQQAIRRAAQLIEYDRLTGDELRQLMDKSEEEQNIAEIEDERDRFRAKAEEAAHDNEAARREIQAAQLELEASRREAEASRRETEQAQRATAEAEQRAQQLAARLAELESGKA